jgi:hypothetical protein
MDRRVKRSRPAVVYIFMWTGSNKNHGDPSIRLWTVNSADRGLYPGLPGLATELLSIQVRTRGKIAL